MSRGMQRDRCFACRGGMTAWQSTIALWNPAPSDIYLPLHAAPVLPAHLEERFRNLPERAQAHGLHQLGEDVAVLDHGALEPLERFRRLLGIARMKFC